MIRVVVLSLALMACGGDGNSGPPPLFAENYATTYQQVRNCRNSLEHGLRRIRVVVDAAALTPYQDQVTPFPVGAVVLKVEYDDNDPMCTEDPIGFTVMKRLAEGTDPAMLDWAWQELDGDRKDIATPAMRCVRCHEECIAPPDGYVGTCTQP
ncbi:MAG: cytochrome P460 family protein [Myxococcota bacterium]|nr:cytochrome P460 family protein [Deltaproteobacteria bacterium]MDQ3334995.1 cytochrome P460 family protein [Myxococcota bacterium]